MRFVSSLALTLAFAVGLTAQDQENGWRPLFDGKSLAGWHGQRHFNPYKLASMPEPQRKAMRAEDDASVKEHWRVEGKEIVNDGSGAYLTTDRDYGDAEFRLEYRTVAKADSGIYLRGSPQVQIWDYTEAGGKWKLGADKGSGGLWNNQKHERFPPACYDKAFGEWNTLWIRQVGALTWVKLNGETTVDGVVMENYWDRKQPLPARGPLQLQTHGGEIRFRNLQVRELDAAASNAVLRDHAGDGFESLFDGKTFAGWRGATEHYEIVDGALRCKPNHGGNLFTDATFSEYVMQLDFKLPTGGNNGLAIHYSGQGNPARNGFEIQVLDNTHEKYAKLKPWQYCGSIYGVAAAARGCLRPVGEWNHYELTIRGPKMRVMLNGFPIVDADVSKLDSALDAHDGKNRTSGHFGFCGHNDPVEFRAIAVKRLGQ